MRPSPRIHGHAARPEVVLGVGSVAALRLCRHLFSFDAGQRYHMLVAADLVFVAARARRVRICRPSRLPARRTPFVPKEILGMNHRYVVALCVVVALAIAVATSVMRDSQAQSTSQSGLEQLIPVSKRKFAPDFALTDAQGQPVSLAADRGSVVAAVANWRFPGMSASIASIKVAVSPRSGHRWMKMAGNPCAHFSHARRTRRRAASSICPIQLSLLHQQWQRSTRSHPCRSQY
jgi:hypothetical protein